MRAALNWKEIEILAQRLRKALLGDSSTPSPLPLKGLWIAKRPHQPNGFLKDEWIFEFHSKFLLVLGAQAGRPYLSLQSSSALVKNTRASLSPFGLMLLQHLEGSELCELQAIPRERALQMRFQDAKKSSFEIFFTLIPAVPELWIVRHGKTLARSRAHSERSPKTFELPSSKKTPENPPIRESLASSSPDLQLFSQEIEHALLLETFDRRLKTALSALQSKARSLEKKLHQSEQALLHAHEEKDWQRLADTLKAALPLAQEPRGQVLKLLDPIQEAMVEIPWNPRLSAAQQLKKLYELSKKKKTRLTENQSRFHASQEDLRPLKKLLETPPKALEWDRLAALEAQAGTASSAESSEKESSRIQAGKSFRSREGLFIFVGRNAAENMEITFQQARGNDLWMHLKGKPGAHAIIALPSKKSASLETLLDAAQLVIHYSGGSSWGKTEVDYTFRKHVKRTKNRHSSHNDPKEAPVHYTQAKTLVVEPDSNRLKTIISRSAG